MGMMLMSEPIGQCTVESGGMRTDSSGVEQARVFQDMAAV